jgi:hypothetical protein
MYKPTHLQAHCQSPTSQRSNQSFVKELAKPARVTAFQDGFRITHKEFLIKVFVNRFAYLPTLKKTK